MLRDDENHHDINVRPTPRSGWWLMVCVCWDALFWRRKS